MCKRSVLSKPFNAARGNVIRIHWTEISSKKCWRSVFVRPIFALADKSGSLDDLFQTTSMLFTSYKLTIQSKLFLHSWNIRCLPNMIFLIVMIHLTSWLHWNNRKKVDGELWYLNYATLTPLKQSRQPEVCNGHIFMICAVVEPAASVSASLNFSCQRYNDKSACKYYDNCQNPNSTKTQLNWIWG